MIFNDFDISRCIIKEFSDKLFNCVESDVLIAGAGPSGLIAAIDLSKKGYKTTIIEKKLSIGGGIWGGGMEMNVIVIQKDAVDIIDSLSVRKKEVKNGLFVIDSIELTTALCLKAIQSGTNIFNLCSIEDVCIIQNKLAGLVINRTPVTQLSLHVDPITLGSKVVIDATGHDAVVANLIRKHKIDLNIDTGTLKGEMPMDAQNGEAFVVEHTGVIYPNLFVTGMAVCAVHGGPRMGPIFGGMLISGKKAASLVSDFLS